MTTLTVFPANAMAPTYTIPSSEEPTLLESKFGDGYVQASPDGINYLQKSWELRWENLTHAEKDVIINFLRAQGGYLPFMWTCPGETVPTQVKAKKWSSELVERQVYTVTTTFILCYTP